MDSPTYFLFALVTFPVDSGVKGAESETALDSTVIARKNKRTREARMNFRPREY